MLDLLKHAIFYFEKIYLKIMCRNIFKGIFVFLAFLLGFISLLLLSARWQLLNSGFYKNTLSESGIYKLFENIAISTVNTYVSSGTLEPNSEIQSNYLLEFLLTNENFRKALADQTVKFIKEDLDVQQVLQDTVEKNLDNFIAWANGEKKEILIYLPLSVLKAKIDNDKISQLVTDTLAESANLSDLPTCNSDQLLELLIDVNNIDIFNLPCTHPEILNQLNSAIIMNFLGTTTSDVNIIDWLLPAQVQLENDTIAFTKLVTDAPEINKSLETIKQGIEISNWLLLLMLLVSVMAAFAAVLFSTGNRFSIFFKIYLFAGILLLVISVFAGFVAPDLLANSIDLNTSLNIGEGLKLDTLDAEEIEPYLKGLLVIGLAKFFTAPLIIGGFLVLINSLLFVISKLLEGRYKEGEKPDEKNDISKTSSDSSKLQKIDDPEKPQLTNKPEIVFK